MAHKKPHKLKALLGSKNQHSEPAFPPLDRDPPDYLKLNAVALGEWYRQIDDLLALGVLTSAELSLYADYCKSFARKLELELKVAQEDAGPPILDKYGNAKRTPTELSFNNERNYLAQLRRDLGFTSVDRHKVSHVGGKEEQAEADPYAKGPTE